MSLLARVAKWQTRWLQVPVFERTWGFKSPLAHHLNVPHTLEEMDFSGDSRSSEALHGHSGIRRLAFFLFVATIPAIWFYLLGARSIEPINGQDGYAYIGIVARTQDFLYRFPNSYFGFRFGYILPSMLFRSLFGFELGHHLLRFVLLAITAHLMRIRGQLNTVAAIVVISLFSISPIVLVSTFNTYTMSVGALVFFIGLLVLTTFDSVRNSPLLRTMVGGAILAVAWNSHLQLLAPAVVVTAIVIIDNAVHQKIDFQKYIFKHAFAAIMGAVLVCLTGSVIYGIKYGLWDLWTPGLKFASKEPAKIFETRGFEWIAWRQYVLLVPVSVSLGIASWMTEENLIIRRTLRQLTLATAGIFAVYAFYQWILKGISLEIFFHSSGLFVVTVGLLTFSIGCVLRRNTNIAIQGIAFVCVSLAMYAMSANFDGYFPALLTVVAITLVVVLWAGFYMKQLLSISAILALAVASWVTVSSPHDFPASAGGYRTDPLYDMALFSYDRSSLNRGSVVDQISQDIPGYPSAKGDLLVWFNPSSPIDQLSAPFLWYKSSLQDELDPALPTVTPTVSRKIQSANSKYIVIIGKDLAEVTTASKAIRDLAPYEERWKKKTNKSGFEAVIAFLERQD